LPEQFDAAAVVAESREVELAALRDCLQHVGGDFVEALNAQLAGDTTEQIATRLAISSSTVYTRVNRAKNQLRDCMKAKLA
jgi:DNA-directed RNA polymerase specialized sigma24 family protein